ncbi:MAG: sulfotransferase [Acidimicrobiia bacterium]|nr:sulfotransferase [Acidimicrobiia bacterium]
MNLWRRPARSDAVQAAYAAAEADRQARPERYLLEPDHIVAVAAGEGPPDQFADGWRAGLEHYVGSAREDGRLNALGTGMVVSAAVSRLRAGATMARYLDDHPEAAARPLTPPIVIIGGWRTGTTFLYRLLATDPRLRGPLPSELTHPTRVAHLSDDDRERFLDASSRSHDMLHFLNPELQPIHESGARLPEECVLAMGSDLRNWGFASTVRLESYARWLAGQDMAGSSRRYRQVLQVLDRSDDRRWVLKAPAHTAELPHLAAAFPGAVVVHLHRDIVETIASGTSLFAVFRAMYSDHVDGADVGRYQADTTELWLRRAEAFRATPASKSVTFVDLGFPRLVRDPVGSITEIYAAADMEPPPDPEAFVDRYHAAFPRHAHGSHAYSAADFGLDAHAIRERFADLENAGA